MASVFRCKIKQIYTMKHCAATGNCKSGITRQCSRKSTFSGAVRSHYGMYFTRTHCQIHTMQYLFASVGKLCFQSLYLKQYIIFHHVYFSIFAHEGISADRSFQGNRQKSLRLNCKLHRQLVHHLFGITVDNKTDCFLCRYTALIAVKQLFL